MTPENIAALILFGIWLCVMLCMAYVLYYWHRVDDEFHLQKFITSPNKEGIEQPDLAKLILLVALIASVFVVIKDASDGNASPEIFGLFLGAWVLNRAISLSSKVLPTMVGKDKATSVKK